MERRYTERSAWVYYIYSSFFVFAELDNRPCDDQVKATGIVFGAAYQVKLIYQFIYQDDGRSYFTKESKWVRLDYAMTGHHRAISFIV